MRKKIPVILSLSLLCMSLYGCGGMDAIPEMSEKQADMVTEYAAGSVLTHTTGSKSRLVDTTQEYNPDKMTKYEKRKKGIAIPEPEPAPAPEEGEEQTPDATGDGGSDSAAQSEQKPETPSMSPAEVMGIYGLDVALTGFEVLDSYPKAAEGTDLVFSMDASAGNKLVVAQLVATNNSGADMTLDTISRGDLHFKLVLNGSSSENTLVTLLSDDFSAMNQDLAPGEQASGVLITQVSDELASTLSSVDVSIQSGNGTAVLKQAGASGPPPREDAQAPADPEEAQAPEQGEPAPEAPAEGEMPEIPTD
ncbi:MAG: hypothetical protein K6E18_07810 [Lachnospiraceae bacterium]|nr:hypothetical protein [Lachnospiraceae bacterium]